MAYSDDIQSPYFTNPSPSSTYSERASFDQDAKLVEENEIVQGCILWLPPKDELPTKAVRRAHGKGAVEEGIYNHPVVIISRPADDAQMVHFHLITSFQGKKLHEMYGKPNEFHASRRSWYLPISPAPDHPDATSKKARKRFPTLSLTSSAALRWDSYVNIRHVYKIDWTRLRTYTHPDTSWNSYYRLERESTTRMIAKCKILTTYEVGMQYQKLIMPQSPGLYIHTEERIREVDRLRSPKPKATPHGPSKVSGESLPLQPDFLNSIPEPEPKLQKPPKAPPDGGDGITAIEVTVHVVKYIVTWTWLLIKRL